eukprot:COSAG01_NODE_2500_length_7559_cov_21.958847_7_plen_77_part_00
MFPGEKKEKVQLYRYSRIGWMSPGSISHVTHSRAHSLLLSVVCQSAVSQQPCSLCSILAPPIPPSHQILLPPPSAQ